jgi:hypothetical protein
MVPFFLILPLCLKGELEGVLPDRLYDSSIPYGFSRPFTRAIITMLGVW